MALFSATGWLLKGGGPQINGSGVAESDFYNRDRGDEGYKMGVQGPNGGKPKFYRNNLTFKIKIVSSSIPSSASELGVYFKYKNPKDGKFSDHIYANKTISASAVGKIQTIGLKNLSKEISDILMTKYTGKPTGGTSDIYLSFRVKKKDSNAYIIALNGGDPDYHCDIEPWN